MSQASTTKASGSTRKTADKVALVEQKYLRMDTDKKDVQAVSPGDEVKVHAKIKEGDKERIQIFEGTVIALNGAGGRRSFTVRKISHGVGVERVFPMFSPSVAKVEVVDNGRVRRSKLYYLRGRVGKAARLKSESETQ